MNFLLEVYNSSVVDYIGGGSVTTGTPAPPSTVIDNPSIYAYLLMGFILGAIIGALSTIFLSHILKSLEKKDEKESKKSNPD